MTYSSNYLGKAHVVDTSTTSANVNLSHDCRRIRLKAHTQDVFFALGNAAQIAEGEPAEAVAVTTAASAGVAEVRTVTLSGFYEVGDKLTVVVDGTSLTYEVTAADQSETAATTLTNVAASVRDALNSDATISASFTATASSAVVTITHGTDNTAFTLTAEVTERDDDNHFLDKLAAEGILIDVPPNTSVAVKALTGAGKVYISEYV
jgi:Ca2+-binding RTX toxin-like protein